MSLTFVLIIKKRCVFLGSCALMIFLLCHRSSVIFILPRLDIVKVGCNYIIAVGLRYLGTRSTSWMITELHISRWYRSLMKRCQQSCLSFSRSLHVMAGWTFYQSHLGRMRSLKVEVQQKTHWKPLRHSWSSGNCSDEHYISRTNSLHPPVVVLDI